MNDPALEMYKPWLEQVLNRSLPFFDEEVPDDQHAATLAANHQRRTFGRIPRQAMDAFRAAAIPALQTMAGAIAAKNDKLFTQALRCLLIVPQFALVKSNHTISTMDLVGQINHFVDGPRDTPDTPEPLPQNLRSEVKEEEQPAEPSDLTEEQLRALKRAKWMASEGRFSKAAQAIHQAADGRSGVLEPTPPIIQKLVDLHPGPSNTPPPCPNHAPFAVPIVKNKLLRAGKRIANGSA